MCVCVYCIYNLYVRAWGCGVSLSMPGSVVVLFQVVSAHTDLTSVFEAITHSWTQDVSAQTQNVYEKQTSDMVRLFVVLA